MERTNMKGTFVKYVSLNIIGMMGLSCYILADTFFVAQGIGVNGLSALNLAIPIYSFINGTGLMIGMGGATRYSISKSKEIFTQSLYYVFFISFLFLIVGIFFSNKLATLLGADSDTLQNANIYLRTILNFAPMFLLNNVILCFVRNDGNPQLSMAAMLIGSFSNIILDYIFIFPCKMGMFGAAFATGIAPVISLMILSLHFIKKKNTFNFKRYKPKFKTFIDIMSLGVSSLITEFSSGIVIIVINIIILKLEGNVGVAAYGVIANIALVVISVFTGISQGIQPIISSLYSHKNKEDIKKVMKYGYITAATIAIAVYCFFFIFAEPIVGVFNKDSNLHLAEIATRGIRVYFIAFIFAGINILSATYFSSVENPKYAFIISILRGFIIIIPTAFILSELLGIFGVWVAMTVTELIVLMVCAIMLRRTK